MSSTTLTCSYIVKTADLGWRQHRHAYSLIVSRARQAFILAPSEAAPNGQAARESCVTGVGGWGDREGWEGGA